MIDSIPLPALLAVPTLFGPLTSWLASRRRRSSAAWFLFGSLLGPIALGLLLYAPLGHCEICDTPARGWGRECETCGASLRVGDTEREWSAFAMERPWPTATARTARRERARAPRPSRAESTRDRPAWQSASRRGSESEVPQRPADGAESRPKVPPRVPSERPATDPRRGRPEAPQRASQPRRRQAASGSQKARSGAPRPAGTGGGKAASKSRSAPASVLASGVCIGGVTGLIIGARYVVNREGGDLVIFGPVDLPNGSSVVRASLATVDITLIEDQLLITRMSGGRSGLLAAFRSVAAYYGVDIEHEIAIGRDAAMNAG